MRRIDRYRYRITTPMSWGETGFTADPRYTTTLGFFTRLDRANRTAQLKSWSDRRGRPYRVEVLSGGRYYVCRRWFGGVTITPDQDRWVVQRNATVGGSVATSAA